MNMLKAGFSKVDITPEMGAPINGYTKLRYAEGVLDELEAVALAVSVKDIVALFISVDICHISGDILDVYRKGISEVTEIPLDNIIIACTHTHTSPMVIADTGEEIVDKYIAFLGEKLKEVSKEAIADLTEAKMGYGVGEAKNISFARRFVMKDGSIKTNPGVNNPDIVRSVGDVDERISVLRFDRVDGKKLVFANFATHPDVVGGSKISADWPGLFRHTLEKTIDNTSCIIFNGAQGDVNHVNVHPKGGDFNDMFVDFDDVSRGYEHARHMAYVLVGGVLQCFQKVSYVDVDEMVCREITFKVPSNMPKPEDMENAYRIVELYESGRADELPFKGMMLTTVVAEARRMIRLEHGPEYFDVPMSAVKLGPVAFVTIAGEGFSDIGIELKKSDKYQLVMPIGLANDYMGYFPMMDSYEEGGYESRSSNFKAGVAERIIEKGKELIESL